MFDNASWAVGEDWQDGVYGLGKTTAALSVGNTNWLWASSPGGVGREETLPGSVRRWSKPATAALEALSEGAALSTGLSDLDYFGLGMLGAASGDEEVMLVVTAGGADAGGSLPAADGTVLIYSGDPANLGEPVVVSSEANRRFAPGGALLDYDGDGTMDWIGHTFDDPASGQGESYLLFAGPVRGGETALTPDLRWPIDESVEHRMSSRKMEAAGDLNGDGFGDIATGAFGGTLSFGGLPEPAPPNDPDVQLFTEAPTERGFFYLEAGGDVDGDGYGDLLLGDPSAFGERGATYVLLGPPPPTVRAAELAGSIQGVIPHDETVWETGIAAEFDYRTLVAAAPVPMGDVDGDGRADVGVLSLSEYPEDLDWAGYTSLNVFLGPVCAGHDVSDHDALLTGPGVRSSDFGDGFSVADLDADGRSDLVWGAMEVWEAGSRPAESGVFLFTGASLLGL